ncbi:MAG TPA: GAP family protein [Agromyces sp.]
MNSTIGEILPLALGIAISPVPIIAAILMLLSPKAKVTSVGYLIGWVVGIVVAVTIFVLLASVIPSSDGSGSSPVTGIIQLVLGALLLLVAVWQWRGRPKAGEQPTLPKWMQAIDHVTFWKAVGLGFLLSAVNPKNLLLAAAAGTDIGTAGLDTGDVVGVIAIYTLIAACTVLVPVVAYLLAAEKMRKPLDALREWLGRENAVIMAVLLLVIGIDLIGKGIAAF